MINLNHSLIPGPYNMSDPLIVHSFVFCRSPRWALTFPQRVNHLEDFVCKPEAVFLYRLYCQIFVSQPVSCLLRFRAVLPRYVYLFTLCIVTLQFSKYTFCSNDCLYRFKVRNAFNPKEKRLVNRRIPEITLSDCMGCF